MATRSSSSLEQQLLNTFDTLVTGKGVRLLLLGDASKELEAELRNRASNLTRAPNMDGVPDGAEFEAAIVTGRLERERWDRWELQRLHALLRPGGTLVVTVPNLASLWSLSGLAFIGSRIFRELRIRRARRSGFPMLETGPFRGRRYRASTLHKMLDGLGFEIKARSTSGTGLYRVVARLSQRLAQDTSCDHIIGAQRLPSLWTADAQRPFPKAEAHVQDFEGDQAPSIRIRDAWASRHPVLAESTPAPLNVASYAGRSVLVLAPHPDDEIIGCGGTLRRLITSGARVTLLHATDGSDSAAFADAPERLRTTVRVEEAGRVAAMLGADEINYWRADNRDFRMTPERIEALAELLARVVPQIVFVPFVTDVHRDHLVLSRTLAAALPKSGLDLAFVEVFNYEVWSLVPANVFCDVTELMPLVERLLLLYETALKVDDYVHLCANRMFYNACRYMGRNGYADAFLVVPANEYLGILREQERERLQAH